MAKAKMIELHTIKFQTTEITLFGDTPLVTHRFAKKAEGQMFASQMKASWPKKTPRVPDDDFEGATYYIDENGDELFPDEPDLALIVEGKVPEYIVACQDRLEKLRKIKNPRFGFPSVGFKAAAIRGCKPMGLTMTDMRGAFFIPPAYVEIHGDRTMNTAIVRLPNGGTDIRFRPEWKKWWVTLPVKFNPDAISADAVFNVCNMGGFACGVGEWRTEKSGRNGSYHVATAAEMKNVLKTPKKRRNRKSA